MKKYIVFGSGHDGKEFLHYAPSGSVAFFCDNNESVWGKKIENIPIISWDELKKIHENYTVVIAMGEKTYVRRQLEIAGIEEYVLYMGDNKKNVISNNDWVNQKTDPALDKLVERTKKIDPLKNYSAFKDLVVECKKTYKGEWVNYSGINSESTYYGHAKALMDYAGLEKPDYINFPIVWHGPFCEGIHWDVSMASICSGIIDKKIHNKHYPYIPIFAVGPYIQYARPSIAITEIKRQKEENGKTILCFLPHSCEGCAFTIDPGIIIKEIQEWSCIYNKVIVCAYWHDIDDPIYATLHEMGYEVVSAGFRFDQNFINRQRTLFELCDAVAIYESCAAEAYALAMNKELYVFRLGIDYSISSVPRYLDIVKDVAKGTSWEHWQDVLYEKRGHISQEFSIEEQNMLDACFGLKIKRDPEEIRLIYEICSDIWQNCDYKLEEYASSVYQTYWKYQKEHNFLKLTTLSNALGSGFIVL